MSNIFKGWSVSVEEDKRIVDSNDLLEIKVRENEERQARLREMAEEPEEEEFEEGFTEGLSAENIDALTAEDAESALIHSADKAEHERLLAEIEQMQQQLDDARAEAEGIIEQARAEAEALKQQIFAEAKEEGFAQGSAEGVALTEQKLAELQEKEDALAEEYDLMLKEVEPKLVKYISEIYEHIFKVELSSYDDMVINLLTEAMADSDGPRNIIIHVSRDIYENVSARKEEILNETGMTDDNVEIVQDGALGEGGCMIETDNGVYDCSLDTELTELRNRLTMLSFSGD